MFKYKQLILLSIAIIIFCSPTWGKIGGRYPENIASDDHWHYHNVGELGLTITNYGILGQGYNVADQPSCMYKLRTNLMQEQVEHFSYAGIWIGGKKQGTAYVSTAIYDGSLTQDDNDGGWEFTSSATDAIRFNPIFYHLNSIDRRFDFSRLASDSIIVFGGGMNAPIENGMIQLESSNWDTIITRSSISDASGDPLSNPYARYAGFFDPQAVSHQDLICAFTDTNEIVPGTGIQIANFHTLGVHVYLEAYAWYHSFANSFSILDYTVTNIPTGWRIADHDQTVQYPFPGGSVSVHYSIGDTIWLGEVIESPYLAMWVDASVANMNYTSAYDPSGGPGGRFSWYNNLNDYDPQRHLALQYDYGGDAGWSQSYLGVKILGAQPRTDNWNVYYHQWTWQGSSYSADFPMPQDEEERYNFMGSHGNYLIIPSSGDSQDSWMIFLSCGPMPHLAPGQRFKVAVAIIAARWNGSGADSEERRANLYRNAEWAQIAYNGEDRNGNGVLDPGEDLDGDGKITRYILPEAPPPPQIIVIPENHKITLYWNNYPESAVDPISNKRDFEGYRIYGAPKTEGVAGEWALLAEYDVDYPIDPSEPELIGNNTGFDRIRVPGDSVQINGARMHYRWENVGIKNGWPRELYYSVTAFDRGDPYNNLPSLQSPENANRTYAFPGTVAADDDDDRVGVYPNPYRGSALWDGQTARERLIWFRHLPPRCEITIFTLAGERVDRIHHNAATYQGDDVERISKGSAPGERRVFSGGEHAWDLLTEDDQEIATGLYIFTVENLNTGKVKTGKFLVLK